MTIEDVKAVSVADDKNCKIEVTGKGQYDDGDPVLRLAFTNKSEKELFIYTSENEFEVDGKKIEGGLGDVASPGETVDAYLFFDAEELGGGAEKLKNVKGKIHLGVEDSEDDVAVYDLSFK